MRRDAYKRLGEYIAPYLEKNVGRKVTLSQGINNNKYFQTPRQVAVDSENDQIVRTGQFAYNKATTRNGDKISIAYREGPDCTVSSAYQVFYIKDEQKLNPHYLLMWFKRPEFDRYARFKSFGSAHEFFTWEEMCNVYLPVPDITEQQRIVGEYQAIEQRIENNNRLIKTLEATAQAIYHHTFVEIIDSENLPEGWKWGKLSDLGEIVGGATPSTEIDEYWCENGISWLSPADLSKQATKFITKGANDITERGYKSCSTKMLPKGSVLFSSRAPIGLMAIATKDVCTNQGFKSIVPKVEYGTEYVFYYLSSIKNKIAEENIGSTFSEVSGQTMKDYKALLPTREQTEFFSRKIQPLFNQQYIVEQENSILTKTLNLLLSKLS